MVCAVFEGGCLTQKQEKPCDWDLRSLRDGWRNNQIHMDPWQEAV